MGLGYQFSDRRFIDYDLWYDDELPNLALRGPQTVFDSSTPYWCFIGAAQTFGRFVEMPFPQIVSAWKGIAHRNLGLAGAGPAFYADWPKILERINQSTLCFLQVMSGRSISTNLLRTVGFGGVLEFTDGKLKGQQFLAADAYAKLRENYSQQSVVDQLQQAKTNWLNAYRRLIERIKVPTVAVWISRRGRDEQPQTKEHLLLGDFPHLITPSELRVFEEYGVRLVGEKLVSKPEQLLEDFAARKPLEVYNAKRFPGHANWSRSFNTYYPTPEMHRAIASTLIANLAADGLPAARTIQGHQSPRETILPTPSARATISPPPKFSVASDVGWRLRNMVRKARRKLKTP